MIHQRLKLPVLQSVMASLVSVVSALGLHRLLADHEARTLRGLSQGISFLLHVLATHGVTVNTSAFLACYQCYCAGSSLTLGLNLRTVVCGVF